jgi:hypothetical protein
MPTPDRSAAQTYEKSRIVEFSFSIPFAGKPADTCEEMLREHITRSLLNSLSEIHPDIRCSIHTRHLEAIRRAKRRA